MYRELIHGLQPSTALLRPKFPVSVYCCATEEQLLHSSIASPQRCPKISAATPASGKSKVHWN